jgi:hypothetical protein
MAYVPAFVNGEDELNISADVLAIKLFEGDPEPEGE